MHILLIHQAFASLDEPGGTRHHELARYLAEKGHRVTVIASPVSYLTGTASPQTASAKREKKKQGEVVILRTPVYAAHHRSFFHRLLAFFSFMFSSFFLGLRVRKVDVVWGTSPPIFQSVTAWLLARLKRVPFLFEVRDLWPAFAVAVGVLKNPLLIRLSQGLERFLYRRADRLIVNSPGFIPHVLGCGARRVDLVPNGADPEMFVPADRGGALRRLHHLEDKFVALYAGAHGISNDLQVVLEAARLLARETDIQIVLVGDGKEKPNLQRHAAQMSLGNVLFLPPVPKKGMAAALSAADACVAILLPVEAYKTTYPNKVFDYMAAGRPVVLAIDGVIREVVESADCGLFSRPGDPTAMAEAIRLLAADKRRARAMGQRGRRYVEEFFSRQVIAGRLLAILDEMVVARS